MKSQHVFSASAAAVLVVSMAAFAQTPQSASPSTQTSTPSSEAASPSKQSSQESAQANKQTKASVTLVGCVMRETEYRKATGSGKGGPVGTGIGRGDEFVLANAMKTTASATPSSSTADCGTTATGEAYELSGSREKDLATYVGRRVEITGTLKEAKTETAATGEAKPTGGFDPLKQDLKLFEVDIVSFRPVASSQSAAAPAPPAASPAPEPPAAAAPQPAPAPRPASPPTPPTSQQSASPAAREKLPRTASPLPVIGMFGLLSMATGLMLRRRG